MRHALLIGLILCSALYAEAKQTESVVVMPLKITVKGIQPVVVKP